MLQLTHIESVFMSKVFSPFLSKMQKCISTWNDNDKLNQFCEILGCQKLLLCYGYVLKWMTFSTWIHHNCAKFKLQTMFVFIQKSNLHLIYIATVN